MGRWDLLVMDEWIGGRVVVRMVAVMVYKVPSIAVMKIYYSCTLPTVGTVVVSGE
jgi:hypothetical protein